MNCTFADNNAQGGAGVLSTSVAWGGSAYGGAIYTAGLRATILNVTMADNRVRVGDHATSAQALGGSLLATNGMVAVTNTIFSCSSDQTSIWGRLRQTC